MYDDIMYMIYAYNHIHNIYDYMHIIQITSPYMHMMILYVYGDDYMHMMILYVYGDVICIWWCYMYMVMLFVFDDVICIW